MALSYLFLATGSLLPQAADITYLSQPTVALDWQLEAGDTMEIIDPDTKKTIYQVFSAQGYPIYYYQHVVDNVCFDSKCRPIQLNLYWNITGRYLGFCLENGEFLSRRDHKEFDTSDYHRLHALLADPLLPFRNVSFDQLVEPERSDSDEVDAVSGATSKQLSAYVVEGAAYTTYLLWSVLYGSAQDVVRQKTESQLDNELILKILGSPSSLDQIWGLNRIDPGSLLTAMIEQRLLKIIGANEFSVAHSAINAISQTHLRSGDLQQGLFAIYQEGQSNLRKPILDKLDLAVELDQSVLDNSYNLLPNLNGNELGQWLKLYDSHAIGDLATYKAVARLLENKNNFIARKAYGFLENKVLNDNTIDQAMRDFESKRGK